MVICHRKVVTPEGLAIYWCPSESRPYEPIFHHPAIDLTNGRVDCTCEDFECRKRPLAQDQQECIDIGAVRFHCKHLESAIRDCIKRGDILIDRREVTPEIEEIVWTSNQHQK